MARRLGWFKGLGIVCALWATTLTFPRAAHAIDPDVRTVLTAGVYGIAAGTFFGLAAYPLTRNTRTIFMGSSIGLYLGLVAGVYHISNRDDPGNPFNVMLIPHDGQTAGAVGVQGVAASYRLARF